MMRRLIKTLRCFSDCAMIRDLYGFAKVVGSLGDSRLFICRKLGELRFLDALCCCPQDSLGFYARFDDFTRFDVGLSVLKRVEDHPLRFLVRESISWPHVDGRILPGSLFLRGNAEDAVGIDQEFHVNERESGRHRWNSFEIKLGEAPAILNELTLTLKNMDLHVRLTVDESCKSLTGARRNRGVPGDDLGHHATHRLDTQRKGSDVQKQHVPLSACKDVGLNSSAQGYDFIRVQVGVRYSSEQRLDACANQRDPR